MQYLPIPWGHSAMAVSQFLIQRDDSAESYTQFENNAPWTF